MKRRQFLLVSSCAVAAPCVPTLKARERVTAIALGSNYDLSGNDLRALEQANVSLLIIPPKYKFSRPLIPLEELSIKIIKPRSLATYREYLGRVDAVLTSESISSGGCTLDEIISHSRHVIFTGPVARSCEDTQALIDLAKQHRTTLSSSPLKLPQGILPSAHTSPIPSQILITRQREYSSAEQINNSLSDFAEIHSLLHSLDRIDPLKEMRSVVAFSNNSQASQSVVRQIASYHFPHKQISVRISDSNWMSAQGDTSNNESSNSDIPQIDLPSKAKHDIPYALDSAKLVVSSNGSLHAGAQIEYAFAATLDSMANSGQETTI